MKHIRYNLLLFAMSLCVSAFSQLSEKMNIEILKNSEYCFDLCKYLHKNPELSFQEFETSKKMASELRKAGFEVTENFGGNNVVGIYKNGNGLVVLLRTDMDALPVEEKTGLSFASQSKTRNQYGDDVAVMHACGHDIHMSVWVGTIRTLVAFKNEWKGTLVVLAQQAEEVSGGAGLAIEKGLFSKFPKPDYALSYHINPEIESGKIGLSGGPVFAGVKTATIKVFGVGGHGAYPEKCIDPIVIASRIVLDLQTIVSREISPFEPVVVTVGSIHGGTRPNIIPDEVKMELTLRYYSEDAINKVLEAIHRICKSAAEMAGIKKDKLPEVVISDIETPPVINDFRLAGQIKKITQSMIGDENIVNVSPAMVGEDFGKFGCTSEKIPICLIWLGSTAGELMKDLEQQGKKPAPLHSPYLYPDYLKTIKTGIEIMTNNVINLMNQK